jgi:hypothetical protein
LGGHLGDTQNKFKWLAARTKKSSFNKFQATGGRIAIIKIKGPEGPGPPRVSKAYLKNWLSEKSFQTGLGKKKGRFFFFLTPPFLGATPEKKKPRGVFFSLPVKKKNKKQKTPFLVGEIPL